MQTMSHLQALHAALQRRHTNPLPCQLEPAPDPLPCQLGPAPERPRARRGKLGDFKQSLSTTGLYLLRRVADGRMQATDAQDTCAHIVNDYGDRGDVVAAIAASGTHGAHPQNCYRDIMRFVHQIGDTLDPVDVEITLRNPDGLGNITRMHPVLYPHDILSNMHKRLSQTQFATLIGADGISTFWDRHKNSPWVQNHPGFPRSVQTDIAVPIYIHADAGQHTNLDKILVISWGSSVTSASTLLGLFLFTVLPCALMIAGTTDEQLYQVLVWCLWVLLRGEHPATDHTNTPWLHGTTRWAMRGMRLAGRYCALFSEDRGDWEWQIATFRWRGYRHNFICHRCWASKVLPSLLFTDWAATALWQTTSLSHEGYMESTPAVERTVLCTAPGWRLERTLSDKMHCINLGLLLHLIANVLWFLTWSRAYLCLDPVDAGLPADASWDQVLHELEVRFHRWGKAHNVRCQVPRFTLNAINRDSQTTFPHYKCKASKSDKIVAWLADVTCEYAERCSPGARPEALRVATCTWGMAEVLNIMRCSGRYHAQSETDELLHAGTTFLFVYSHLACISATFKDGHRSNCWNVVPKFHQFHELLLDVCRRDAAHENPRFYHCFGPEDMVGRMIRIAASAHHLTMAKSVLRKYCLLLQMLWGDLRIAS